MTRIVTILLAAVTVAVIGLDSAFAGATPAPAPIIGAGLPVLAVAGGAYWLYRRFNKGSSTDD